MTGETQATRFAVRTAFGLLAYSILALGPLVAPGRPGEVFPFSNFNLYRRPFGGEYRAAYASCADPTNVTVLPDGAASVYPELIPVDCRGVTRAAPGTVRGDCFLAGRVYRDYRASAHGQRDSFIFVRTCRY